MIANKLLPFYFLLILSSCVGNNADNSKSNDHSKSTSSKSQLKNQVFSEKGTSDDSVMTTTQMDKANQIIAEYSASADNHDGAKVYKTYCSICHGRKGDLSINQAKDLTVSNISLKNAVAQVYFGKGLMTPFKDLLNEDQIIAVSKYVETFRK